MLVTVVIGANETVLKRVVSGLEELKIRGLADTIRIMAL